MSKETKLWNKAISKAVSYAWRQIDEPPIREFEEIGEKLGSCTKDVGDLRALLRIASKARSQE